MALLLAAQDPVLGIDDSQAGAVQLGQRRPRTLRYSPRFPEETYKARSRSQTRGASTCRRDAQGPREPAAAAGVPARRQRTAAGRLWGDLGLHVVTAWAQDAWTEPSWRGSGDFRAAGLQQHGRAFGHEGQGRTDRRSPIRRRGPSGRPVAGKDGKNEQATWKFPGLPNSDELRDAGPTNRRRRSWTVRRGRFGRRRPQIARIRKPNEAWKVRR